MKSQNRFFDEMAKMATGAVGAFAGFREHIQTEVKTQIGRFIVEMDFVPREDFEIVEAMAREARLENQRLAARLAVLESKAGIKTATVKKAAPKAKTAPKKTAAKKTTKKK